MKNPAAEIDSEPASYYETLAGENSDDEAHPSEDHKPLVDTQEIALPVNLARNEDYRLLYKSKVLRIFMPDPIDDAENHYRVLITFFGRPWRSEATDIIQPGDFQERYLRSRISRKKSFETLQIGR